MNPKLLLAAFSAIFILVSCSPKESKLPTFDFSRTNFKTIELSDDLIVKRWNRVDLESTDEIFIPPYYKIIPCNSCIIAYSFNHIVQFSPEGKFLKIIAREGNGPEEVNSINDCIYDPAEEKLYWAESFNGGAITCYNLKTDTFDTPIINYSKSGLSAIRKNGENSLICFPYVFGESTQPVYTQDLDGNLIDQKRSQTINSTGAAVGIELNVFSLNDNWYYQGNFEDTLFNALTYEPTAIFSKGKELNLDNAINRLDNSLRSLKSPFTTDKHLFLRYVEYKLIPDEGALMMYPARTGHYLLDNNLKNALIIKSFLFSPLGKKYEGEELDQFFSKLSSHNPKYVVYIVENEEDNATLYIGELF